MTRQTLSPSAKLFGGYALRSDKIRSKPELSDAASGSRFTGTPTHHDGMRHPRSSRRIRNHIRSRSAARRDDPTYDRCIAASLPEYARFALNALIASVGELNKQIDGIEKKLTEIGRSLLISSVLSSIPGVGPITSTAIAATIPDARMFRSGREFAAWLGLTPR